MNIGKSSEVSSNGGREDGAATLDERPHKKARFAWQIKGKYHLKNKTNHPIENSANTLSGFETVKSPTDDIALPETVIPPPQFDSQSSLRNVVSNNLNEDFSAVAGSSTPISSLPDALPTYVPTTQRTETMISTTEIDININWENGRHDSMPGSSKSPISPRNARRLRREEDRCISQWQTTQTVKGCFDNTINRVLESWMNAPAEERFQALDFAQFMNHLPPEDDNIENEGILMAISAHGLQSVPTNQYSQRLTDNIPKRDEDSDSSLSSSDFEIPTQQESPPPSPLPCNEHMTQYYEQSDNETNNIDNPWELVHNTNEVPFVIQPDPFQYFGNNSTVDDYNDDFMNTAVLHAIQSKGLVASGTDFG